MKAKEKPAKEAKGIKEGKKVPEDVAPILEKIKQVRGTSKPRKFSQTWDLIINLKGIDLKKPENRFNLDFVLPEGRGKDLKVAVIADSLVSEARGKADMVIEKQDIEALTKNKKKARKIANDYDWFLAEASLMPLVGKSLGVFLGPRGRMARPIPLKVKVEPFIERAKKSVRVAVKESPVVSISIGTDEMPDENVAKNLEAAYNFVKEKLPKGVNNIKSVYLKLTMGKPVKLEI